jgi:hypothetical protein
VLPNESIEGADDPVAPQPQSEHILAALKSTTVRREMVEEKFIQGPRIGNAKPQI